MSSLASPERPEGLPPRPVQAGRPWRPVLAIPVAIAAVVGGALAYTVASAIRSALVTPPAHRGGLVGVALHGPPPLLTFSSTFVQDLVLVACAVWAASTAFPRPLRLRAGDLGLRPARLASSAGLVALGYVGFLVLSAAWTSGLGITSRENVPVELGTKDSALALVGAAFLVAVVAPICEELFFRGYLFGSLRRYGLWPAALIVGVCFGLAHVISAPIGFIVPLGALGVILCLLYERTGSLYPSMALHAVNNSIAFAVGDGRGWLAPACLAGAGACFYALSRGARRFA